MIKERLDVLLVKRGLFESRAAARAAIDAGGVRVDGVVAKKPASKTPLEASLEAVAAHPYVSRGGVKLAHAIKVFDVDPAGRHCLDIGASTGGFCDVLLRAGAASIAAVDVGHGQLHDAIGKDPRVQVLEGQDARGLTRDLLAYEPSLIVCDASFIALEKLLDVPLSLGVEGADFIGLFKPQFQVGRGYIGKRGIVTDEVAGDRAAVAFADWLAAEGWQVMGWEMSPITGGDGNSERLIHAKKL